MNSGNAQRPGKLAQEMPQGKAQETVQEMPQEMLPGRGVAQRSTRGRGPGRPGPGDGRPFRRGGELGKSLLQIRDVPRAFPQALLEVPCLRLGQSPGLAKFTARTHTTDSPPAPAAAGYWAARARLVVRTA